MKLDRLVAKHDFMGRTAALRHIAAGEVEVNGRRIVNGHHEVDRFMTVTCGGEVIQRAQRALYLMLHKPVGIVSATVDAEHPTVLDLIDDPAKEDLHLVGRLDRFTSGLVLLTNDGRWSKRLMEPARKVPKVYLVETAEVIDPGAVEAFARGFHFPTEDIVTAPAELVLLGERMARLTLREGRYHQVKRMFHRVQNRVVALHRESIGTIVLPEGLLPGQWRVLTAEEVRCA